MSLIFTMQLFVKFIYLNVEIWQFMFIFHNLLCTNKDLYGPWYLKYIYHNIYKFYNFLMIFIIL